MSVELDWALFRRLIKLELVLLAMCIPAAVLEQLAYSDVGDVFDTGLSDLGYRDAPWELVLPFGLALAGAYVLSLVGMLKRKRWGRALYVAGLVVAWPLSWLMLPPVAWSSNYTEVVSVLASMVSGAVLLLAFSREHGARWFTPLEDQS